MTLSTLPTSWPSQLRTAESACRLRCSAAQRWMDDRWQIDWATTLDTNSSANHQSLGSLWLSGPVCRYTSYTFIVSLSERVVFLCTAEALSDKWESFLSGDRFSICELFTLFMTCDLVKKKTTKKNKKISTLIYFSLWNPGNIFFFHDGHFFVWFTGFLIILWMEHNGGKKRRMFAFSCENILFPKKKKVLENVLSVLKNK